MRLQIALQHERRRDAINRPFALFATDIGLNQHVLGRLCGEPLIPGHDRHLEGTFQHFGEPLGLLSFRPPRSIHPNRKPHHDLAHRMTLYQIFDVLDICFHRPSLEGLQRLGNPAHLITDRHPNPLRPGI